MDENMTNASERETLLATRDTVAERRKEVCLMAIAHQKKTMEDWIKRLGFDGKLQVARIDLNCGMSVTTMPDERGRTDDIDMYFNPDWGGRRTHDGARVRSLEISIRSTRLSVERENDLLMATVAGKFAENVAAIEADLRAFDWHSVLYRERKMKDEEKDFFRPALQIHVNFVDGKGLRIDTNDAGDIETLRPLVKELLAYHDSLFEE